MRNCCRCRITYHACISTISSHIDLSILFKSCICPCRRFHRNWRILLKNEWSLIDSIQRWRNLESTFTTCISSHIVYQSNIWLVLLLRLIWMASRRMSLFWRLSLISNSSCSCFLHAYPNLLVSMFSPGQISPIIFNISMQSMISQIDIICFIPKNVLTWCWWGLICVHNPLWRRIMLKNQVLSTALI